MTRSILPLLLLLLVCIGAVVEAQEHGGGCGVSDKRQAPGDAKSHFKLSSEMEKAQVTLGFHPVSIPIIFHFVKLRDDTTTAATAPSQERLERAVYVINLVHKQVNSGFSFTLNNTLQFHEEPTMTTCAADSEMTGFNRLAGKYNLNYATALNIYICKSLIPGAPFTGYGIFPYLYENKKNNTWIYLATEELVTLGVAYGGPTDPLYNPNFIPYTTGNVGTILVHEVGHWLGLFHPFQAGCECCYNGDDYCQSGASSFCQSNSDPSTGTCGKVCGDSVADTPAIENPQDTLSDKELKTCKYDTCNLPGVDDTLNLMSYDYVECHYFNGFIHGHFTFGQVVRMRSQMLLYRKEFFPDIFPVGGRKTWTKTHSKAPLTAAQSKSNSPYPSFKKTQNVRRRAK